MKMPSRIVLMLALLCTATHSLHAEFLELKIRESTAESIWHWALLAVAAIIFFTLRASRSKGGHGR